MYMVIGYKFGKRDYKAIFCGAFNDVNKALDEAKDVENCGDYLCEVFFWNTDLQIKERTVLSLDDARP
jgi:hypothetical protein